MEGIERDQLSVAAVVVDPLARVILVPSTSDSDAVLDLPHELSLIFGEVPNSALRLCKDQTSRKGEIVRCLGLFQREAGTQNFNEIAFVVHSQYTPYLQGRQGARWVPSNDVHGSNLARPAKDELDRFL